MITQKFGNMTSGRAALARKRSGTPARWTPSVWIGVLLALALALTGCGGPAADGESAEGGPLTAVATTGMIADVVANIGGEHVTVVQLMGPGVDPHLYKATESDVNKIAGADIIFYSGLNLEARMAEIFERMASSRPTVAVGEAVPQAQRLLDPSYENQPDPHIWMDVKLWRLAAESIRDGLIELDPAHADAFRANAESYLAQMDELEGYIQAQIARVPQEKRVLVTAHDAFQYFGQGYGYEVFAPQGISTASEAGVDDIRRTIDLVVERQIPAIFVESSVPRDVVEAIVAGAKDRGHDLAIGGELFSDAMGDPGTVEGTYLGMIRHNVDTIVGPYIE